MVLYFVPKGYKVSIDVGSNKLPDTYGLRFKKPIEDGTSTAERLIVCVNVHRKSFDDFLCLASL
jgi:hypothetical protein